MELKDKLTGTEAEMGKRMEAMKAAAKAVMAHALEHYEEGWDFMVECYSVEDILKDMVEMRVRSAKVAIKHWARVVDARKEREAGCY